MQPEFLNGRNGISMQPWWSLKTWLVRRKKNPIQLLTIFIHTNTCRNLLSEHYADFNLLILSLLSIHKTYGSPNAQSSVISHLAPHLTSSNVPNYPSDLVFPTCVLPRGFTPFPEQINWCMLIGVTLSLQWKWQRGYMCALMNICLSVCAHVCV